MVSKLKIINIELGYLITFSMLECSIRYKLESKILEICSQTIVLIQTQYKVQRGMEMVTTGKGTFCYYNIDP